VEAHVHGTVDLGADVEALVLDPCYAGTAVEAAAGRLGCPVEWDGDFQARLALRGTIRQPGNAQRACRG
jgi:hypothetical protein